jgi:hypothetical protein
MSTPLTVCSLEVNTAMEFTADFFDASSAAWHANKIRKGHSYVYRCEAITKTEGKPCKNSATATTANPAATKHLCKTHIRSASNTK